MKKSNAFTKKSKRQPKKIAINGWIKCWKKATGIRFEKLDDPGNPNKED